MTTVSREALSAVHRLFRSRQSIAIAEMLRAHGLHYKVAFGLTLPEVKAVKTQVEAAMADSLSPLYALSPTALAEALWQEDDIREAKLLAPMLYPRGTMSLDTAERWADTLLTREIADVAAMYVFQYEIGRTLLSRWQESSDAMRRYTALSLHRRLEPSSTL